MTNKKFAQKDVLFLNCCKSVVISERYDPDTKKTIQKTLEPTRRQASKFRMQKGRAYNEGMKLYQQKAV